MSINLITVPAVHSKKSVTHPNFASKNSGNIRQPNGKYVRVTFIDCLKYLFREFEIFFLTIKKLGYQIANNKQRVAKLRHRIKYLRCKDSIFERHFRYKKSYLVPSMNLTSPKAFREKDRYENAIKVLRGQVAMKESPLTLHLKRERVTRPYIKSGVCAGACIDFAKNLLPKMELEGEEFHEAIMSVAAEYHKGITEQGVANQMLYYSVNQYTFRHSRVLEDILNQLKKAGELTESQAEFMRMLVLYGYDRKEIPLSVVNYFEQKRNNPEIRVLQRLIEKLRESQAPLNERSLTSAIQTTLQEFDLELADKDRLAKQIGHAVDWFLSYAHYGQQEKNGAKFEIGSGGKGQKRTTGKYVNLVELEHDRMNSYARLLPVLQAQKMTFEPLDHKFGMRGQHSDAAILANYKSLNDGIYYIISSTKKNFHAMLYIKRGDRGYYWDSNEGLIDCGKEHSKRILKVLKTYSEPRKSKRGMNHDLMIAKVTQSPESLSP